MLQQHMAVTCCQGSLSPGLASPALGQMAAHWALKSNCAAQDTRPALSSYLGSSCLPGGLFSYSASSHAKTPPCSGDLIWFPSKLNGKENQINKMCLLLQFYHSPAAAEMLKIIQGCCIQLRIMVTQVLKSNCIVLYWRLSLHCENIWNMVFIYQKKEIIFISVIYLGPTGCYIGMI